MKSLKLCAVLHTKAALKCANYLITKICLWDSSDAFIFIFNLNFTQIYDSIYVAIPYIVNSGAIWNWHGEYLLSSCDAINFVIKLCPTLCEVYNIVLMTRFRPWPRKYVTKKLLSNIIAIAIAGNLPNASRNNFTTYNDVLISFAVSKAIRKSKFNFMHIT